MDMDLVKEYNMVMNPGKKKVNICRLFSYASSRDRCALLTAVVCSCLYGGILALATALFGKLIGFLAKTDILRNLILDEYYDFMQTFNNHWRKIFLDTRILTVDGCTDLEEYYHDLNKTYSCKDLPFKGRILFEVIFNFTIPFGGFAVLIMVVSGLRMALWLNTAERQVHRIRKELISSVVIQDIEWFQRYPPSVLKRLLSTDVHHIKEGMNKAVDFLLRRVSTALVAVGIALVHGVTLTAIISGAAGLKLFILFLMSAMSKRSDTIQTRSYASAEKTAQLALNDVRTVTMYGTQKLEIAEYSTNLKKTRAFRNMRAISRAIALATVAFSIDLFFVLAVHFGTEYSIDDDKLLFEDFLIVVLCVQIAAMSLTAFQGQDDLKNARIAAYSVMSLIDETKKKRESDEGRSADEITGAIRFENVCLEKMGSTDGRGKVRRGTVEYTQAITMELTDVSFDIPVGQTVALIGPERSGAEFVPELLLGFRQPTTGTIYLDDTDLTEFKVNSVRQNIGYVTSEPVIFSTSIAANLRVHNEEATDKEIIEALTTVGLWDLVENLPHGMDTVISESKMNFTISQIQRICLATALVSDPAILILDRITDKMDGQSDFLIEQAIDKAKQGRTTIIIPSNEEELSMADFVLGFRLGQLEESYSSYRDDFSPRGVCQWWLDNLGKHEMDLEFLEAVEVESARRSTIRSTLSARSKSSAKGSMYSNRSSGRSKSVAQKSVVAMTTLLGRKSVLAKGIVKETKAFEKRKQYRQSVYDTLRGKSCNVGKVQELDASLNRKLFRYNSGECAAIFFGCVASIGIAVVYSRFATQLGDMLRMFILPSNKRDQEFVEFAHGLLMLSIPHLLCLFLQELCFTIAEDRLTMKLRKAMFMSLMKQEMQWFDFHSSEELVKSLYEDSMTVRVLTGRRTGNNFQTFIIIVVCMVICLWSDFFVSLIVFANIPFMFVFGYFQSRIFGDLRQGLAKSQAKALRIAIDSIRNIRTVVFLNAQERVVAHYMNALESEHTHALKKNPKASFLYAISSSIWLFGLSSFSVAVAYFVEQGETSAEVIFKVFCAIVIAAIWLGSMSSVDVSKARIAAKRLFAVLESRPNYDYTSQGHKIKGSYKATVKFDKVTFSYSVDPDIGHLINCSFSLLPGTRTCLVGTANSGVFAVLDLLMRLYEPHLGDITLNDKRLDRYHMSWYRSQIGYMSTTPALFDRTIADILASGDTTRAVTVEEIVWALKNADVYDAVNQLPQGIDSKCDNLTAFEQQKVDLSRLLVRNPKIFVADRVLNNIDSDEKADALWKNLLRVTVDRTLIYIPARRESLMAADYLILFHDGKIVAQGSHDDLMEKGSQLYSKLAFYSHLLDRDVDRHSSIFEMEMRDGKNTSSSSDSNGNGRSGAAQKRSV